MARILTVDDDVDLSSNVKAFLKFDASHDVDWCPNGTEGWERLQSQSYDCIILDWQMPGMTGPELCRAFRQAGGSTPVILLTGLNSIDDKETGLDAGADDYLTKPFELKELGARVRALLRRASRLSESESSKSLWNRIERFEEQDPFIGTTIADKYDVLSLIGLGGMGIVYKAHHNILKRSVALKILLPHLALNPDVRKRFQQEAESASRLAHPNIVSIYDFGLAARGLPFIAMDFLQGKSLEDIIATESPLAAERCIDIFLQTCNGLEHAHAARVVHRDLKPSNLLVLEDGTVKLLDFGLAKPLPQEGSSQEKLTQTGQVFGSPEYMSPEQCRGIATDQRSDIYSFGCLMYETLSGAPPFQSENPIETIKKQVSESAAPLKCSQLAASMREGFEAIILKAMAKDRNARYQTMSEVKADLLKLSESPKSDFSSRLKTLWNINTLRLSGAAEDQTLMLKTAVVVLGIFVVLSCIAGIGFCVYWSMAHPESKI